MAHETFLDTARMSFGGEDAVDFSLYAGEPTSLATDPEVRDYCYDAGYVLLADGLVTSVKARLQYYRSFTEGEC